MAKQYDRLVDSFPETMNQDATSLGDNLWRMKVALDRIRGRRVTIDKVLKKREKLALYLEEWRNTNQHVWAKPIRLGAMQKAIYQLEDMVDDIEYTQRKQHEAKFCRKLYMSHKLSLVLKFRKTEDLLHNLSGLIEKCQKQISAETSLAVVPTEPVAHRPPPDDCVLSPDVISGEQSSDSITKDFLEAMDFEPESDGPHSRTEDLQKSLFKANGNFVITYGLAQGTGKVTIPVQEIFKDETVQKKFKILLYVRASDKPISSSISPERTLEASILEIMNSSTVNIVGASNKKVEEHSRPNKEAEELIIFSFESKILLVLENVLEDQLPNILYLISILSCRNTESRIVISSKSSELLESLSGMIKVSDKDKQADYSETEGFKGKEYSEGLPRKQKPNIEDVIYWRFFRSFAFRDENKGSSKEDQDPGDQKEMKKIGKRMSLHLNKFPLRAKMIGKMLHRKKREFRDENKGSSKEDQDPGDQKEMKEIGKRMSLHLNKFPLGAKMIGKMLHRKKRDYQFWAAISEKVHRVVKSGKSYRDMIQPLLQICYDELPAPLRLCFQYCSLFPSNWTFTSESLVRLWMPQGFLVKDKETPDDVGKCYFSELHSRSFFEEVSDDGSLYSFHASVHGFAQVTAGEVFMRIESDTRPEDALHVRHLSVNATNLEALYNVDALYSVRTIIIFGPINPHAPDILDKILPRLRTTRTLDLSGCRMKRLPELATDLRKHLRYLNLYDTRIEKLPEDFCEFVHLQVLNLLGCHVKKFPSNVTRLCNLRHIDGPTFLTSEMHHVGKFKDLQELEKFEVSKTHKIQELGYINDLRGSIAISNLEKVKSGSAAKAKLHAKANLNSLKLEWSSTVMRRPSICRCNSISLPLQRSFFPCFPDKSRVSAKVLDRLKPHSGLHVLEINRYIGGRSPSWFTPEVLGNIVDMSLRNCMNWQKTPPFGQLPQLKTLKLEKWDQLESFGGGTFVMVEELSLEGMPELSNFEYCPDSFPSLKLLTVRNCKKIREIPLLKYSILREIYLEDVGLNNLPLPTINQVEPSTSSGTDKSIRDSLTRLTIQNCPNLETVGVTTVGGKSCLPSSLLHLQITACEKIEPIGLELPSTLQKSQRTKIGSTVEASGKTEPAGLKLPSTLQESQMTEISQATDLKAKSVIEEPPSLRLRTAHVDKISLLEPHFHLLSKLEELVIEDARLTSLGKLPGTLLRVLKKLSLVNCEEFEALPEDMKQFESLNSLHLKNCQKISSLPYLPYNLDELRVDDCPLLKKRYREDSVGWTMISHVPYKYI